MPEQERPVSTPSTPLTRRQLREWEQGAARVELARTRADRAHRAASQAATRGSKRFRPKPVNRRVTTRPSGNQQKSFRKRVAAKFFSFGAMVAAAGLIVGTTVPANAFYTEPPETASAKSTTEKIPAQTFQVAASVTAADAVRDSFGVTSYAELLREQYGSQSYTYATTSGSIRWPFPYPVPISSGYGYRECSGCTTDHHGIDFTPGEGAAIYAIADGVVASQEESAWGYGNHVIIDHVINGQHVQSLYAHMQYGTSPLVAGEIISVGDFIGLVGNTGQSYGAHLHFEIRVEGVAVDPYAWLVENAVN